jgi:hypothetical protein
MAVQNVPTTMAIEPGDHPHVVSPFQSDSVFPTLLVGIYWSTVALKDLKLNKMNVHGVDVPARKYRTWVHEMPDFDIAQGGSSIDPDRIKPFAVDVP